MTKAVETNTTDAVDTTEATEVADATTAPVLPFSLEALLNPEISHVAKSTDGLVITSYGFGGVGKTPVAVQMEKPFYLAFGKSGLSGLNNIPFQPIKNWADFKRFNATLTDPRNFEQLHQRFQTIILDEVEIAWRYCEEFLCQTNGVTKIKEGNSGYGLWQELQNEWESEMLKIIGSGFCVHFILHAAIDEDGTAIPVGDKKRMLPIILNHSEIIGYVEGNGVDEATGKRIHSSMILAGSPGHCFARTRNDYFDVKIEDYTAENLIKAYYDALDRQEKVEGVAPVTKAERDKQFETETRSFDEVMDEIQVVAQQVVDKFGGTSELQDVVESVLGVGKLVADCTPKQQQAVEIILSKLRALL